MSSKRKVSRKTKERYKKSMNRFVKDLSRKVLVYKQPIKNECPNCYYDKLTDSSTGKCKWTYVEATDKQAASEANGNAALLYKYFIKGRCPVCRGQGYVETQRRVWVNCLINWDPDSTSMSNNISYTPAGTEGSTIVLLKTDPKYFDVFKNSQEIVIDGISCRLSKAPILRGLGNQALLIVTAFTTEKPSIDSTEIIKGYS